MAKKYVHMFKPRIGQAFWAYHRPTKIIHRNHFLDTAREQAQPFTTVEYRAGNVMLAVANDGTHFVFDCTEWGYLSAKKVR